VEFSKRPFVSSTPAPSGTPDPKTPTASTPAPPLSSSKFNPHHIITPLPATTTLEDCLRISDVVISAVPNQSCKVPTRYLKDGAICVSVAQERNFEADVRDRVSPQSIRNSGISLSKTGRYIRTQCRNDDYRNVAEKSVRPTRSLSSPERRCTMLTAFQVEIVYLQGRSKEAILSIDGLIDMWLHCCTAHRVSFAA
jgi:hypothetical protein